MKSVPSAPTAFATRCAAAASSSSNIPSSCATRGLGRQMLTRGRGSRGKTAHSREEGLRLSTVGEAVRIKVEVDVETVFKGVGADRAARAAKGCDSTHCASQLFRGLVGSAVLHDESFTKLHLEQAQDLRVTELGVLVSVILLYCASRALQRLIGLARGQPILLVSRTDGPGHFLHFFVLLPQLCPHLGRQRTHDFINLHSGRAGAGACYSNDTHPRPAWHAWCVRER